jgi:hypothetical protein
VSQAVLLDNFVMASARISDKEHNEDFRRRLSPPPPPPSLNEDLRRRFGLTRTRNGARAHTHAHARAHTHARTRTLRAQYTPARMCLNTYART